MLPVHVTLSLSLKNTALTLEKHTTQIITHHTHVLHISRARVLPTHIVDPHHSTSKRPSLTLYLLLVYLGGPLLPFAAFATAFFPAGLIGLPLRLTLLHW